MMPFTYPIVLITDRITRIIIGLNASNSHSAMRSVHIATINNSRQSNTVNTGIHHINTFTFSLHYTTGGVF